MKKKFLVCFFAIFLLIIPVFSASAVIVSEDINGSTKFAVFNVNSVDFIVTRDGLDYDGGSVSTHVFDDNARLRLNLDSELGNLQYGDYVTVMIELKPIDKIFTNSNYNVTGSFEFGMKNDATVMSGYDVYRTSDDGTMQTAFRDVQYDSWGDYVKCVFNKTSLDTSYTSYWIGFKYKVGGYGDSYARYIYLRNCNFTAVQREQYFASQIESSIDKHTDKIVDNQNKNTDKIINGWDGAHDVDGSAVNDYAAAEGELNSATENAQSDSISFFNNFGNLFQDSHLHNGLLAVSAIFKEYFAIDWLSSLLSFGLGLGAFAFILGSASLVITRTFSNQRRERYAKERSSDKKSKGGGG